MRELYCGCALSLLLYFERGYYERKKRKLQWVCCRLYPFILLDNKKEGPGNFSGGRIPHWVNHIYLCLYCIVYLLCFISTFVLFYFSTILFVLTKIKKDFFVKDMLKLKVLISNKHFFFREENGPMYLGHGPHHRNSLVE
jgi:hypothetical protein